MIEDIPRCNRERQAVAMIRKVAVRSTRAASSKTPPLSRHPSSPTAPTRDSRCVPLGRKGAVRSARAGPPKTPALSRRSSWPPPERAAGAWAATGARVCRFRFFSKTKRLTQPEIQSKFPRSGQKINGHDSLARLRIRIKTSVRCLLHGLRSCGASGKRGALIEQGVSEWVLGGGDVERAPGAGNH